MGAKEMVERIKDEASEEREQIIREARDNANKKIEDAKAEIERQKQQFAEAEERKGVEEKERIIRAARQNARKLRWTAEEAMIDKALEAALERIKSLKKILRVQKREISPKDCWNCGDAIMAVEAPNGADVFNNNQRHYIPICEAIGKRSVGY